MPPLGWSLEADPSLNESAVAKLKLDSFESKCAATPGAKLEVAGSGCEVRSRRLDPRPIRDADAVWPGFDQSANLVEKVKI